VTSSSGRNMAVNFWWASDVANTTTSSCDTNKYFENSMVLKDLKTFKPGEWFRFMLGEMLLSENHPMTYFDVTQNVIDEHSGKKVVTSLRQFNLIDKNSNGVIDYHEIVTASSYDVHKFFKFSKIGTVYIKNL